MSCIVPNTPPLTGYGPRAHCALNSTFTLHSQLRICELLAISLRTAQPSLAPPRRHVIASITRSRTSPRSISSSRQFAVSQTRFVCSSLNSSSPHSSCFRSQQLRYQTEQLVPTSLGSSHVAAPILALSTRHAYSFSRNHHVFTLHAQLH